jgi:VanZ family protein
MKLWWRWSASERVWRAVFWLTVCAGIVLALWPHPEAGEPWFPGVDKIEHALSFAVLVWMGQRAGYRRALALAIGLLLLGGAIELAQGFLTTTRTAEWLDWLADAAGITLGFALVRARRRALGLPSGGLEQEHGR